MLCPFVIKVCTKCGRLLVANEMNFHKEKMGKYGVRADCKECYKRKDKKYYENNKDKILEKNKKYRENNRDKITEYQKEYGKEYYENNKDKILENQKEYRENNKDKILEKNKKYRENNPHIVFNYCAKRRQLEENQGNGITKEQWLELMNFFEWECAYSGIQLNKDNRTIDHIIPLDKGGLNEIWNICPMYKPYNSSKNASDMLEWYQQQEFYSEERLNKIYEWVEYAYNKWGNDKAM